MEDGGNAGRDSSRVDSVDREMEHINRNLLLLVESCEDFEHCLQDCKKKIDEVHPSVSLLQREQDRLSESTITLKDKVGKLERHLQKVNQNKISSKFKSIEDEITRIREDNEKHAKEIEKTKAHLLKIEHSSKFEEFGKMINRLKSLTDDTKRKSLEEECQKRLSNLERGRQSFEENTKNIFDKMQNLLESLQLKVERETQCYWCSNWPSFIFIFLSYQMGLLGTFVTFLIFYIIHICLAELICRRYESNSSVPLGLALILKMSICYSLDIHLYLVFSVVVDVISWYLLSKPDENSALKPFYMRSKLMSFIFEWYI